MIAAAATITDRARGLSDHRRDIAPRVFVYEFAAVPAPALVATVPLVWRWA